MLRLALLRSRLAAMGLTLGLVAGLLPACSGGDVTGSEASAGSGGEGAGAAGVGGAEAVMTGERLGQGLGTACGAVAWGAFRTPHALASSTYGPQQQAATSQQHAPGTSAFQVDKLVPAQQQGRDVQLQPRA